MCDLLRGPESRLKWLVIRDVLGLCAHVQPLFCDLHTLRYLEELIFVSNSHIGAAAVNDVARFLPRTAPLRQLSMVWKGTRVF